jgi:hypothetical protein
MDHQQGGAAYLIRAKLVTGQLPRRTTAKTYAGHGTGLLCDGCEEKITEAEIEHEVESNGTALRFHAKCVLLWTTASASEPHNIAGGSAPLPWTLVANLHVTRDADRNQQAHHELLCTGAEVRKAAALRRQLSERIREKSRELRARARWCRTRILVAAS